jgi:hypothetical protein
MSSDRLASNVLEVGDMICWLPLFGGFQVNKPVLWPLDRGLLQPKDLSLKYVTSTVSVEMTIATAGQPE